MPNRLALLRPTWWRSPSPRDIADGRKTPHDSTGRGFPSMPDIAQGFFSMRSAYMRRLPIMPANTCWIWSMVSLARMLWRPASGGESVRRISLVPRCAHGQTAVAFPDRAPRREGLRSGRGAEPGVDRSQRRSDCVEDSLRGREQGDPRAPAA